MMTNQQFSQYIETDFILLKFLWNWDYAFVLIHFSGFGYI